jgi:hypothetical protein
MRAPRESTTSLSAGQSVRHRANADCCTGRGNDGEAAQRRQILHQCSVVDMLTDPIMFMKTPAAQSKEVPKFTGYAIKRSSAQ